ncbi:MAG: Hsp20/alpha crystallin family protein [Saprospiraceae bacterium]|nr:Hsp20/alpha crystallin family protein [Saprospiraceae bacterium]
MLNVNFKQKPFEGSMNNLVDELFKELPMFFKNDFNNTERKGSVPVNVKETANGYQLEVVAPGFEKADFKINLDDSLLTISAERKNDEKYESDKQIRREYSYLSFKRSFTVDTKIDATKIEASYINGVLILNLPKKEEVKASVKEIIIN